MRKITTPLKRHLVPTAMLLLASAEALAIRWQDNSLSYTFSSQFTEPGITSKVAKHVVEFVHVNGYQFGHNMLRLKIMRSDGSDPKESGSGGATEFYVVYRHYISFGALAGKSLGFGPVRDFGLTAGFDINTKNNAFGPRKRMFVLGPTLMFDVPKGSMLQFSLLANKEYNHCGLPSCSAPGNHKDYEFDTYPMLFTAWRFPVRLGDVSAKFEGFALKGYRQGIDYVGNEVGHETQGVQPGCSMWASWQAVVRSTCSPGSVKSIGETSTAPTAYPGPVPMRWGYSLNGISEMSI